MPLSIEIIKTGRVLHRVEDSLGICMIEAGFAKQWTPPQKPEPKPEWKLYTNMIGEVKGLILRVAREDIIVPGPSAGIVDRCERTLAGRKLPLPPDELVDAYRRAVEPDLDPEAVCEARRMKQQRDKEKFREQNKLSIREVARQ